jgi:ornithine cyclodeaminase/alanine dehydrogenase-like protein (mu-crystallin family)
MTLFVGQSDVSRLLPMDECIAAVAAALRALAEGEAVLPLRQVMRLPGADGLVATMPAHLAPLGTVGVKAITVNAVAEGRRTNDEVTLFESLGLAVEDVEAACVVVANAERTGAGTRFELGGARHG